MKKTKLLHCLVGLCLTGSFSVQAQTFHVPGGSTGADGALDVTTNTELPSRPDGVYNYTTINIAADVTLTFQRNANNTPIYLLATGDVTINGTISVVGSAGTSLVGGAPGPGGYAGGNPGTTGVPGGSGLGPGGGFPGIAGNGNSPESAGGGSYLTVGVSGGSTNRGIVYGGPLLIPPLGGSGGGGAHDTAGGGGGGGAIVVCSDATVQLNGRILAHGGPTVPGGPSSGGSGGAIRIVCRKIMGGGDLNVDGVAGGGTGRIRIDTHDRTAFYPAVYPGHAITYGSFVVARLANEPTLRVLKVAGQDPPANGDPVLLPDNSPSTQIIRVEAANFGQSIQVEVALKPVNGTATFQTVNIDNSTENPKVVDVSAEIPGNTLLHVEVYKR